MLNSWPAALLAGTALGFLTGLGIGGGSLLILWLTFVAGIAPEKARIINLLFFLPAAIVSAILRWKQGSLNFRIIFPAVISGCCAAALMNVLSSHWDVEILKKLFGIILIAAGSKELLHKEK